MYLCIVILLPKRARHKLVILCRVEIPLQQLVKQLLVHCLCLCSRTPRHLLNGTQPRLNFLALEVFQALDLLPTLGVLRLLQR